MWLRRMQRGKSTVCFAEVLAFSAVEILGDSIAGHEALAAVFFDLEESGVDQYTLVCGADDLETAG